LKEASSLVKNDDEIIHPPHSLTIGACMNQPVAKLDPRYSEPGVGPSTWSDAVAVLEGAGVFWISTVRPEGHPHVTPIVGVWTNDAFYFATGPAERKALNLQTNPHTVITTGTNAFSEGYDVVLEGDATRITDHDHLQRIADAYLAKYGSVWAFSVRDEGFVHSDGSIRDVDDREPAYVFEVRPTTAFGFGKGPFSQTRWRFS
jgi:general stress protein 26